MRDSDPADAEMLIHFLDAQRSSVLAIVDGLDDAALRSAVLRSRRTPLGLIEHLGYAERQWFQHVATGSATDLPWQPDADDPDNPLATRHDPASVFAFYRDQIRRSNAVLATTPVVAAVRTAQHRHG